MQQVNKSPWKPVITAFCFGALAMVFILDKYDFFLAGLVFFVAAGGTIALIDSIKGE